MDEKEKKQLEHLIKHFNFGLTKYETNVYTAKKHLLDYVDCFLSELVKKFDLDIEV